MENDFRLTVFAIFVICIYNYFNNYGVKMTKILHKEISSCSECFCLITHYHFNGFDLRYRCKLVDALRFYESKENLFAQCPLPDKVESKPLKCQTCRYDGKVTTACGICEMDIVTVEKEV